MLPLTQLPQSTLLIHRLNLKSVLVRAGFTDLAQLVTLLRVLLGNFGNKLDKFVPATSSTTQPTNPVYDGCKYHYLPWLDTKPCVTVDSDWEDNTYR